MGPNSAMCTAVQVSLVDKHPVNDSHPITTIPDNDHKDKYWESKWFYMVMTLR